MAPDYLKARTADRVWGSGCRSGSGSPSLQNRADNLNGIASRRSPRKAAQIAAEAVPPAAPLRQLPPSTTGTAEFERSLSLVSRFDRYSPCSNIRGNALRARIVTRRFGPSKSFVVHRALRALRAHPSPIAIQKRRRRHSLHYRHPVGFAKGPSQYDIPYHPRTARRPHPSVHFPPVQPRACACAGSRAQAGGEHLATHCRRRCGQPCRVAERAARRPVGEEAAANLVTLRLQLVL